MTEELLKVAEDSARGGIFLIAGTALSTVIMAISSILIANILGAGLYGQYTLALAVPQLLFLFTDLGISQGITKFAASFRLKDEVDRIAGIIKHGLILRASVGIAISAISYALADLFASFFLQRPDLAFYIRIMSVAVLFQVIFTTAQSAFIGLDKTEYSALTTNIQAIGKATISIALALIGFGVAGAIIGHVASYVIAAITGILILLLIMPERRNSQNRTGFSDDLKTMMRYGGPLYISVLLVGLVPLYQSVMLALFTNDVEIGNYKAASNFVALMSVLSIPITTALLPAFSKLDSSTSQKTSMFFKLANKYTALIIVPATVLIVTLSNEIVQIVYADPTFKSASTYLTIYSLLFFTVVLGYPTITSLFNGLGDTRTTLKMSLVTLFTLVILSPILTRNYGVQGLIIAFLVASTAGTAYGSHVGRKRGQIEYDHLSMLKIYLASAISAIPTLLVLILAHLSSILSVAIGGLLYLLIYATLIPLAKTMTQAELQTATRITRRIRLLGLVAKPVLKYQERVLQMRANLRRNRV